MNLLYKYRPFDRAHAKECERSLQMLRERQVWMATPSSFNDPFDCQPSILRNAELEQRDLSRIVRNYLGEIKRALRRGAQMADRTGQPIAHRTLVNLRRVLESRRSAEQKYDALKELLRVPPDGREAFRNLQSLLSRVGVFSLSASPTQMLMWAHYASQHSGFVLGFEPSDGSLLQDAAHTKPVKYMAEYPELDQSALQVTWSVSVGSEAISDCLKIDIQEPQLQAVIYSKSEDWEYEQEWRVLVPEGAKLSPYPGRLRRIIFGLRCDPESRRRIEEAARTSAEAPIQLSEIVSTAHSFDLKIRDLNISADTAQARERALVWARPPSIDLK